MRLAVDEIMTISEATGYRPEFLEKVLQLLNVMNGFNTHPFLKDKWVLKGGTALNVFAQSLPRLSVDIDINYIGALDRSGMQAEKAQFEQAIQTVFEREDLTVTRVPSEHAGGKWRLRYHSYLGQDSNLEVDLNYMLRLPLWAVHKMDSPALGIHEALSVPVLDIHELAVGKFAALMARGQARDLFDCMKLFQNEGLDYAKLRTGFVVYGAMNRVDWRTIKVDSIGFETGDINSQLLPTLNRNITDGLGSSQEYGRFLVDECQRGVGRLLPFTDAESEFLDLILEKGQIDASLLTNDPDLMKRIEDQPSLKWKALNVRKHKGLD